MDQRKETDYVPGSFAERGLTVPFTTPIVAQARVRLDGNDRIEFILPSLSGGKGRYVMPWSTVQSLATTTLHDRALYDRMSPGVIETPAALRRAALQVASKGLAGPKAARAAQAALAADENSQVSANFLLVARLLSLVGMSTSDILDDERRGEVSRTRVRAALGRVADSLTLPKADLYHRVEALSVLISPLGLADAPQPGRLRDLARTLAAFTAEVQNWATSTVADVAQLGSFVGQVANATQAMVQAEIDRFDAALAQPAAIFKAWEGRAGAMKASVARTELLLDGWEYLLGLWRVAAERDNAEKQSAIADLFRLLPMIPKSEGRFASAKEYVDLGNVQRRWVRANEDWRSGRLDFDQVHKIEAIKAQLR
ncbi:MAG: hypothetical protein GC191_16535 [Azospirillum sp.]|nr:hypothetical protein [Azospirillum sp.]